MWSIGHNVHIVHIRKYYCESSHKLRQEQDEQTDNCLSDETRSFTAEGEPGEENCPDKAGGDCPAGGRHGQDVLWC